MNLSRGFKVLIGVQILLLVVLIGLIVNQQFLSERIGPRGPQGVSGPMAQIDYAALERYIDKRILTMPTPANGVDGKNGKDGEDGKDATKEQIAQAVTEYLSSHPPAPGKDGITKVYETRCVQLPTGVRWDQKYSDGPSWQVAYYLPGGVCG